MAMAQITFDTLAYANKLKEVGLDSKIAEMQAKILSDLTKDKLATKDDIHRLENEMIQLKSDLIMKLGSSIIGCTAVLGTLMMICSHIT